MTDAPELQMFGWLIFAWGVALMVIAMRRGKKQVHSPTRRIAGLLGGAVFCLLAAILIWAGSSTARETLLAAAVAAGAISWYLGRHAKKMDRAMR
jgi:multisubunit Na+/H+ antiporter MnhB subunit